MVARSNSTGPRRPRRLLVFVALAAALMAVPIVNAGLTSNGAGGCGQFKDAVAVVQNGDALIPMYDNGQGRNSEGAILTKNVVIEGGWSPPALGCPSANLSANTVDEFLDDGFTYGGPSQRAALFSFGTPALTFGSAVTSTLVYATNFYVQDAQTNSGGAGVFATGLNRANLRFEQVGFVPLKGNNSATNTGNGGGLLLDVNTGSRVTINDSQFTNLRADNGGGFDITVRGASHVSLTNVQVTGNKALNGRGGGGRIILYSGYVTITGSLFSNNTASQGGGALRIERPIGATGPAEVWIVNTRFSNNSAPINADIETSGSGITVHALTQRGYLPLQLNGNTPGARIDRITRIGNTYSVDFAALGFTPQITAKHVHFFFDTVAPAQAGMPGVGPWVMYAGASPFTLYGISGRPPGATRMCVLVANADHTVIQNTGNCLKLP